MLIKLDLNTKQLAKLHEALEHEDNHYSYRYDSGNSYGQRLCVFVAIKKSHAESADGFRSIEHPIPSYCVTLEVKEVYENDENGKVVHNLTPLDRLARVLQAIGRFPESPRVPFAYDDGAVE